MLVCNINERHSLTEIHYIKEPIINMHVQHIIRVNEQVVNIMTWRSSVVFFKLKKMAMYIIVMYTIVIFTIFVVLYFSRNVYIILMNIFIILIHTYINVCIHQLMRHF